MSSPPYRILCVEDDEDTRFMLTYLLGSPEREIVTATAPEAARPLIAAARFNLYVLDGYLRGAHGAEFCREILRADPWAKVVFYSGAALEEDRAAALAAGAAAYVLKPEVKELARTIERLSSAFTPPSP